MFLQLGTDVEEQPSPPGMGREHSFQVSCALNCTLNLFYFIYNWFISKFVVLNSHIANVYADATCI